MLTLEEQERRAYISGDTERAALLAQAMDGDESLAAEVQMLEDQARDAEREAELLREDVARLEEELAEYKDLA